MPRYHLYLGESRLYPPLNDSDLEYWDWGELEAESPEDAVRAVNREHDRWFDDEVILLGRSETYGYGHHGRTDNHGNGAHDRSRYWYVYAGEDFVACLTTLPTQDDLT